MFSGESPLHYWKPLEFVISWSLFPSYATAFCTLLLIKDSDKSLSEFYTYSSVFSQLPRQANFVQFQQSSSDHNNTEINLR